MRVFLTGGTGFIGSELARRLRARGDEVAALVRHPDSATALADLGCELHEGSLSDGEPLAAGMRGADAAIHGAAVYEIGITASRRSTMYEANVIGTENFLAAAAAAHVPRSVYISTINAFGNTRGQVVDETHQHDGRYVSYYDETKHLAHETARRFITQGLPLAIVQPGGVYGPGDHSQIGNLIRQFMSGRLPALAFPDTGFNLVHRDDVAAGIIAALDRGRAGESYVLGGELTTMRAAVETLARVAGRRAPKLVIPVGLLRLLAPLGPYIGPPLGYPPNLLELISAAEGVTYWATDAKARRELGYNPRPLEEGLRDTLMAEGYLRGA